ncbi:class I SAM-dependent methyltransferase [bacterium]|nr:class I SAM-dependent methyltransferase [bacterium]
MKRKLKKILRKRKVANCLHLGVGLGYFTSVLESVIKDGKIYAIAPSLGVVKRAKMSSSSERVEFLCMDAVSLAFSDGFFDCVALQHSFHHFVAPDRVVQEISRVLSSNGVLVIHEMLGEFDTLQQKLHVDWHNFGVEVDRRRGIPHYPLYSKEALLGVLSRRFEIEYVERISPKKVVRDRGTIGLVVKSIDQRLESVRGHPDYTAIAWAGESLKELIMENGFSYPVSLLVSGRKRSWESPAE